MFWMIAITFVYGMFAINFAEAFAPALTIPLLLVPGILAAVCELSQNTWKENLGILTIGLLDCISCTI